MITLHEVQEEIRKHQSDEGRIDIEAVSETYELIYENNRLKAIAILAYHNDAIYELDSPRNIYKKQELFSWECSPEEMIVLLGEKIKDLMCEHQYDYIYISYWELRQILMYSGC